MKTLLVFSLLIVLASCRLFTPSLPLNALKYHASVRERTSVDYTCPKIFCATTGQSCKSYEANQTMCITPDTYCNGTYDEAQMCLKKKANGMSCDAENPYTQECLSDNCDSDKGTCEEPEYRKDNGEKCSAGNECRSTKCVGGTCMAQTLGEDCTSDACDYNLYCGKNDNGTHECMARKADGASCIDDEECSYEASACIPTSDEGDHKCAMMFSVGDGGFCSDFDHCTDELACQVGETGIGKCMTFRTPAYESCDNDTMCSLGSSCECKYSTGEKICMPMFQPVPKGLSKALKSALACMTDHCPSWDEECGSSKCKADYCAVTNLYLDMSLHTYTIMYPNCFYKALLDESQAMWDEMCAGSSTTSTSSNTTPATILTLFFLLGALLAITF